MREYKRSEKSSNRRSNDWLDSANNEVKRRRQALYLTHVWNNLKTLLLIYQSSQFIDVNVDSLTAQILVQIDLDEQIFEFFSNLWGRITR